MKEPCSGTEIPEGTLQDERFMADMRKTFSRYLDSMQICSRWTQRKKRDLRRAVRQP